MGNPQVFIRKYTTNLDILVGGGTTSLHSHASGTGAGVAWGDITGAMTAQSDLNTALNNKSGIFTTLSGYTIIDAASSASLASHTSSASVHGAGTVQSHQTTLSGYGITDAASSASLASHTTGTGVHGAGTVAGLADIVTHAALSTGVHNAGTAVLATTTDIATHSALTTGIHSLGSMAQAASVNYASTTVFAAHTATDASHGAGTILSTAAGTVLITTHSNSTAVHGANTINGGFSYGGATYKLSTAFTISSSVLTNIAGLTYTCATGSTYKFDAYISCSCSLTGGIAFGVNTPGAGDIVEAQFQGAASVGTSKSLSLIARGTKTGATFNTVAATGGVWAGGVVIISGTGGALTIAACSGSASGTVTIRTNSLMEVTKIT